MTLQQGVHPTCNSRRKVARTRHSHPPRVATIKQRTQQNSSLKRSKKLARALETNKLLNREKVPTRRRGRRRRALRLRPGEKIPEFIEGAG